MLSSFFFFSMYKLLTVHTHTDGALDFIREVPTTHILSFGPAGTTKAGCKKTENNWLSIRNSTPHT